MRPYSRDLTIDSVLEDPMIRAAMRADRVDARDFERLLRSAAGRLETKSAAPPPAFRLSQACQGAFGLCHA